MNHKIKNLRDYSYEMICFIFNKEPRRNKLRAKLAEIKYKIFDLVREKYYFVDTDYLVISANPIFSNIIANYLKENNIKNAFINNVYDEDSFNYEAINDESIRNILSSMNIEPDVLTVNNFFKKTNCKDYCYTISKKVALSSLGRKYNGNWCFSYVEHKYKGFHEEFSKYYLKLWRNYINSMGDCENQWNNEDVCQKGKYYYVFAKKIILLMDNSRYLLPDILNHKDSVFIFDYNKHNGSNFKEEFEKFLKTEIL